MNHRTVCIILFLAYVSVWNVSNTVCIYSKFIQYISPIPTWHYYVALDYRDEKK